jgi:putative ABC transport system permease protein
VTARASWLARQRSLAAELVVEAAHSLETRRGQASLSALGIAAGVAGAILLLAVVTGLERFALQHIVSAGDHVLVVTAAPERADTPAVLPAVLRAGDEARAAASVNQVDMASAENAVRRTIAAGGRTVDDVEVRGVTAHGFAVLDLRAARGRLIDAREFDAGARVAVLGANLASALFGDESPLGRTIFAGDWPFVVVGLIDRVGTPEADLQSSLDETMFVPFRAAADALHGTDAATVLRFRLPPGADEDAASLALRGALDRERQRRGETVGDLTVTNTIQRRRIFSRIMAALYVTAGLVGGVGLVLGALGVSNVLLVSVRERTPEIGLRRTFGATRRAIFAGLLVESMAIAVSGGIVGVLVALAATRIAVLAPQVPVDARPAVSGTVSLIAIGMALAVGLAAGMAPARHAASISPAGAVRAE